MSEVMPYIYKEESESHPVTGVIKKKSLQVQGPDFDKVKKEFDKRWR